MVSQNRSQVQPGQIVPVQYADLPVYVGTDAQGQPIYVQNSSQPAYIQHPQPMPLQPYGQYPQPYLAPVQGQVQPGQGFNQVRFTQAPGVIEISSVMVTSGHSGMTFPPAQPIASPVYPDELPPEPHSEPNLGDIKLSMPQLGRLLFIGGLILMVILFMAFGKGHNWYALDLLSQFGGVR
jgi:hypothetical protein